MLPLLLRSSVTDNNLAIVHWSTQAQELKEVLFALQQGFTLALQTLCKDHDRTDPAKIPALPEIHWHNADHRGQAGASLKLRNVCLESQAVIAR
jgi:hypothetical protein